MGISFGMYGSDIIFWKNLMLGIMLYRVGVFNVLKYFSILKDGRFINKLFVIYLMYILEECVIKCVIVGMKCVLFDYVYFIELCEF